MPKQKTEVTPELVARATKMHDSGKTYKEIATAFNLASEKVAWHLVNTRHGKASGKAPGKASGKASRRPVANGQAKARPKAQKAPGTPKASPRAAKKASSKASKPDTARAQAEEVTTASSPGKRLNMLEPNGGDRPVARPTTEVKDDEIRPVPKPKDTAAKSKSKGK